ncbi:MAG: SDR family NAD(P)-dependent oxidoreductase [Alphaproteobacteria bacterium]|nr:SDR family NAD(P)-dependent oxidoreductase [Alphaproteobacteria bacterium]
MSAVRDLQGRLWAIVGGSSPLARAFAHRVAARGASVLLVGRDLDDLARTAADVSLRHQVEVLVHGCDLGDPDQVDLLARRLQSEAEAGRLDLLLAAAIMPSQAAMEADPALVPPLWQVNVTAPIDLLLRLAPAWQRAGRGTVVVVGSVAGDRGRLSNHLYGASKAALATFTAGFRNRMARAGVHVLTVKPGFLDTGMTWGLPGIFLPGQPDPVAGTILAAALNRKDVLYVPGFWWLILTILKHIPEPIFKRLKI